MDRETNPTLLTGRRRMTLTIREGWLKALSGNIPEDDEE